MHVVDHPHWALGACMWSTTPAGMKHDITLKYTANVKHGTSYTGSWQLIQTCDDAALPPLP